MAKIFISTNGIQPANCFDSDADQLKALQFLRQMNFPLDCAKEVTQDVYLILDTLTILTETVVVNSKQDFLLFHNQTTNEIKNLFDVNHIKEGHQTQLPEHFYKPVFEILVDNAKNNKFIEILKILGFTQEQVDERDTLEAKLNLLHLCLTPSEAKKAKDVEGYSLIKDLVESVTLEGSDIRIIDHLATQEDCFDENNYLKPLRALRDKLLQS